MSPKRVIDQSSVKYRRDIMKGIAVTGAAGLAGCTGFGGSSGGSDQIDVEFWQTWSTGEYEIYDSWQKKWLNDHDKWKLNQVKIPHSSRRDKITTAVASNSFPSLFRGNYPNQYFLYESGTTAPLDKYWKEYDHKDDMVESLVDVCTYDGKLLAWPQDIFSPVVYYRKDLFNKAGIDQFPETWSEWTKACDKIVKKTDANAFSMSAGVNGQTSSQFFPFVWSSGGHLAKRKDDGSWDIGFDSKASIAALRRYTSHVKKGWTPKGVTNWGYGEVHQNFNSGKAAMMSSGSWSIANLKKEHPDIEYGIANFPKMPETNNFVVNVDATYYSLSKGAENPDEAMEYIKWLTSKKHATEWAKELDHMPILKSAQDDKYFQDEKFEPFKKNHQAKHSTTLPKTPKYSSAIEDPAEQAVQDVVLGNKSPDSAAKDAAKKMRKKLSDE